MRGDKKVPTLSARRPGASFQLEWVGGGGNIRATETDRVFEAEGAREVVEQVLMKAGLLVVQRRVQVVKSFIRSTVLPIASGVIQDAHGARMRVKPKRSDQGFIVVVLAEHDEAVPELTARLERAAVVVSGGLVEEPAIPEPASEAVFLRAAEFAVAAPALRPAGRFASLADFAQAVADQAGDGESPAYWMRALCAAEAAGLLARDGSHFFPLPRQGVAAPGERNGSPAPGPAAAPPKPPPAAPRADPDRAAADQLGAIQVLADSAAGMIQALQRITQFRDARQGLLVRRKQVEAELVGIDRELSENAAAIKGAARSFDAGTLALVAQELN